MTTRINPSKLLLWRNPNDIQIGLTDPVILESVTAEQERLLALFERGVADEALEPEAKTLASRLAPALLEFRQVRKPQLSADYVRSAFAELIRASYTTGRDGMSVLEERAKTSVHIDALGQGGSLIALGLAAAGIGRILTSDRQLVTEQDTGPLGFDASAVGKARTRALEELLRLKPGSTQVIDFDSLTPARARHALRVLTTQNALAPGKYQPLLRSRQPHVAVFFGSETISVSPLISGSPCLGCLDLWKAEADSNWPTLAAQLIGRSDYLEDAQSCLFAAAMVTGEILRAIDSPEVEREFIGHRLKLDSGRVEEWTWAAHETCGCAA